MEVRRAEGLGGRSHHSPLSGHLAPRQPRRPAPRSHPLACSRPQAPQFAALPLRCFRPGCPAAHKEPVREYTRSVIHQGAISWTHDKHGPARPRPRDAILVENRDQLAHRHPLAPERPRCTVAPVHPFAVSILPHTFLSCKLAHSAYPGDPASGHLPMQEVAQRALDGRAFGPQPIGRVDPALPACSQTPLPHAAQRSAHELDRMHAQ